MSTRSVLNSSFHFEINSKMPPANALVYVMSQKSAVKLDKDKKKIIDTHALKHNHDKILKSDKKNLSFVGKNNLIWLLQAPDLKKGQHAGLLDDSEYAWYRDQAAALLAQFKSHSVENVTIEFFDTDKESLRAMIIGFELASYNFLNHYKLTATKVLKINLLTGSSKLKIDKLFIAQAQCEAMSVQLARHLVNLPPNSVNPESLERIIKKDLHFTKKYGVKIQVWDHKRLAREKMNLHLAVGKGSDSPPRMVHIQYRPKRKSDKKPIAFVGKGITFDTGGLDLKPSSAMRLMKKDMGGAAAVLGLAYWVIHSNYSRPCDFYLALAENSVDAQAMRPSDVYKSRAGYLVEIDNTDAEGRLVLADVMDVAAKQEGANKPEILVDLATLTGAIKVALGADVAGLFSNDDKLAEQIQQSGQATGEPNWRMPLIQKYFNSLTSNFADFKNSGEGFGGAITAALFLEKFCNGIKWAHLDIYSWTDKPQGALLSVGGNGQPVQSLIHWLKSQV